jgi:hypothetical protein
MRGVLWAVLEVAWGIVDVKRVASLTLLGPILEAIAAAQNNSLVLIEGLTEEEKKAKPLILRSSWGVVVVDSGWSGKWCHEIFRVVKLACRVELWRFDWCGVGSVQRRWAVNDMEKVH